MVSKMTTDRKPPKKFLKERKGDLIMTNTNKMTKKDFFKQFDYEK